MEINLVRKDKDCGYFGRQLWIPKDHVNVRSIKAGLEFPVLADEGVEFMQLWEEDNTHILVPREFIPRSQYKDAPIPIINVGPISYNKVNFNSRIVLDAVEPDKDLQHRAFNAMCEAKCGLLNLSCGKGKTQIALSHMAHKQVPTLVIVNNTTLIDQWRARIETFMTVDGGIGVVQGDPATWDWRGRGVVLAMIHSLSLRYEEIPEGFDRYFGGIYYDEVHHLSAPLFVHTAPMFYGERWGLTATVNREDGLEPIYQYHIGPTFFRDLQQDIKPRIYIQEVPISIDVADPAVVSAIYAGGKINIPKLRTYLGTLKANNDFIAEKLQLPISKGRKLLVLSHSVDQLRLLHDMFPDSGLCTGREKPAARIETLRTRQITFGTLQLVKEALDEKSLDTIFFLTPFGSSAIEDGGKNTLQQGMGRILGYRGGGNHPVVVIMDHMFIPKFHKACRQLKKLINEWPADEGGPLEYTILRPFDEQERYKK